jgi:hypothetical protein
MFTLAPNLKLQPSKRMFHIGGTNATPSGPRPLLSIFGTDLPLAPGPHTVSDNDHSSILQDETAITTPTVQSSPLLRQPSCLGSPTWQGKSSLVQSSSTSGTSNPCTPTLICHSLLVRPPSSNASFEESNGITANVRPIENGQSPSPFSRTS